MALFRLAPVLLLAAAAGAGAKKGKGRTGGGPPGEDPGRAGEPSVREWEWYAGKEPKGVWTGFKGWDSKPGCDPHLRNNATITGVGSCQAKAEDEGYGGFGFVVGIRTGWKTCCYKNYSVDEILDGLMEDEQVTLYYNGERSLGDVAIAKATSTARNLSAARRASGAAWQPGDPPLHTEL